MLAILLSGFALKHPERVLAAIEEGLDEPPKASRTFDTIVSLNNKFKSQLLESAFRKMQVFLRFSSTSTANCKGSKLRKAMVGNQELSNTL